LKKCVLKHAEIGVEAIAYVMKKPSDENGITLGSFLIYWKRYVVNNQLIRILQYETDCSCDMICREEEENDASIVCSEVQLPQMKVDELPLSVDVGIESPNWVRTPLPMNLVLRNNSQQLLSFDMSIEHVDVDAFMFSGCKQVSFYTACA
jgi:hypothetical protein